MQFPVWVFSHRVLPDIEGAGLNFVHGDLRAVHGQMREAAGQRNIWIVGGGDSAGQFFDVDLLDELILFAGSVTLGNGRPLLPRRIVSPPLQLHTLRRIGPGMVELRYLLPKRAV
jgi:dihydrofolate reductase